MKRNRNRALVGAVALLTLGLSTPAMAGWGDKLMGGDSGDEKKGGASASEVEAQQSELVKSFASSQNKLAKAQSLVAAALKLKDAEDQANEVAESYSKGNVEPSKDEIEKQIESTDEVGKKISEEIAKGAVLDAQGKAKLVESFVPYAQSIVAGAKMVSQASELAQGIKQQVEAASMMSVMKVKKTFDVGLYLAPKIPGYFGSHGKQLKDLIAFAKANKVAIPSEADQAAALPF